MMLSDLLNTQAVQPRLGASSKRDAVAELVDLLEAAHGLKSQGEILDRVMRREAMMSTGIGNGVAIPHGKARALDRMLAACAVSRQGVEFDSVDGEPAYILILLVSPENVGTPHVKVLANISRLLKEESVRKTLREVDSAAQFLAALKSAEAQYLS
ncbi:MAG TPA: PTS sugar transporter subunit IIA [Candidatus Eisenbacteria bacterium]|jgi:mannitol/fructose-specific phosphotransferase system IIA component (Ntr-type)